MVLHGDLLSFIKLEGLSKRQSFMLLLEAVVFEKLEIMINGKSYTLKEIKVELLMDIVGQEIAYCVCWGDGGACDMEFCEMIDIIAENHRDSSLILYIDSKNPIFPKEHIEEEEEEEEEEDDV